jgi:CBS domain-containing protein
MVTAPKRMGPEARVADIRAEFANDRVRMVLVVDGDGRLVAAVEREDLDADGDGAAPASTLGRLEGRTVLTTTPEATVSRLLEDTGRRRVAVVDDEGHLQGLVCLKRRRTGYCGDDDLQARAAERASSA